MKTRAAILATVLTAGVAGTAAGFAVDRAAAPLPPSVASTSVANGSPATPAPTPSASRATPRQVSTTTAEPITPTTPAKPSATPAVKATPTTASNRSGASPTRAPSRSSAFGVGSLLVANDYLDAGVSPVRISTAYEGEGQAAISGCQSRTPKQEAGLLEVFMGVADVDGFANQYAMSFRTDTDARRAVDHFDEWRTWCPAKEISATPITSTSSSAHQVRLAGEAEGQWWTMRITQGGYTTTELVAVVRIGSRVSVVDVATPRSKVDGATLVRRSAARLA